MIKYHNTVLKSWDFFWNDSNRLITLIVDGDETLPIDKETSVLKKHEIEEGRYVIFILKYSFVTYKLGRNKYIKRKEK